MSGLRASTKWLPAGTIDRACVRASELGDVVSSPLPPFPILRFFLPLYVYTYTKRVRSLTHTRARAHT